MCPFRSISSVPLLCAFLSHFTPKTLFNLTIFRPQSISISIGDLLLSLAKPDIKLFGESAQSLIDNINTANYINKLKNEIDYFIRCPGSCCERQVSTDYLQKSFNAQTHPLSFVMFHFFHSHFLYPFCLNLFIIFAFDVGCLFLPSMDPKRRGLTT